jgi:tRNA1(Val) A37 N6-methylase TrmN6
MVGLKVDVFWYEIGNWKLLNSLFSTIAYRLENKNWGSRFEIIMNDFYKGSINKNKIKDALEEIKIIELELSKLNPNTVVWNFENILENPPWGKEISADITNLSNYFVTCNGENLIQIIIEALDNCIKNDCGMEILNL